MQINFVKQMGSPASQAVIYFVDNSKELSSKVQKLDEKHDLSDVINKSPQFNWKEGQSLHIAAPKCVKEDHLFLISIGDKAEFNHISAQRVGAKIADILNNYKLASATIVIDEDGNTTTWASLIFGIQLKNYNFTKYYVNKKEDHILTLNKIEVVSPSASYMDNYYRRFDSICEGVFKTRDLTTEPANVLYPAVFVDHCHELEALGVNITVLYADQMKELGMNALMGVAQGSEKEPYTVIMEWSPEEDGETIAIAGKGVCFDSGGLNIKSSASNIADMKDDMSGAAVVLGVMHAIAKQKLNINVIGIVGLVENMTSGSAQRPSDVVTTMSGQTVEVENTDAEGRLVLCDIMWYVQKHYKPDYLIDIATLTGAVVTALGEGGYAGLFSNNDNLADTLLKLGKQTGEILWRLPLADHYDKQIESEIADMRNTGTARGGGATIAAQFLQRFVMPECKWAHIDIANVAWNKRGTPISPKGATGFGVSLLESFIRGHCKD